MCQQKKKNPKTSAFKTEIVCDTQEIKAELVKSEKCKWNVFDLIMTFVHFETPKAHTMTAAAALDNGRLMTTHVIKATFNQRISQNEFKKLILVLVFGC